MSNYTVDLVIKDDKEMMALIHILIHKTGGGPPSEQMKPDREPTFKSKEPLKFDKCLRPYKFMKFRMKLSYFAWLRNI